ncbi:MAG: hypothetical protein K2N80_03695 [Lachnospiraceae bacterium]|nr:hypothetical protein [Lachnospiraceae bacterium]
MVKKKKVQIAACIIAVLAIVLLVSIFASKDKSDSNVRNVLWQGWITLKIDDIREFFRGSDYIIYPAAENNGTISEKNVDKETLKEQAVLAYLEFIEGRRSIGNSNIYTLAMPTGEPDRRYSTGYAIIDSNGDDIPELHIRTARELTIISFAEGELTWFKFFSNKPTRNCLLNNGAYIWWWDTGRTMGNGYSYFELDESGNKINEVAFYWEDRNENNMCDEDDEFCFDGTICKKDEWFIRTRKYLYTDEKGREQISNQVEWTLYCEADPFETNGQVSCERMKDGYQLTLYDKEHNAVLSESYPDSLWIDGVSEDVLEIGISVGSPASYTYYFNKETAEISETFYNAILVGDKYIAYMEDDTGDAEDRTLILLDIFQEGILYQEITRDFSNMAEPMSAIISVEMTDSGNIQLRYYKGETFTIESEIIRVS